MTNNFDKPTKIIERLIVEKKTNKTRLEKSEATYILKNISEANYQLLASKFFGCSDQYFYYSKLENVVLEFYTFEYIESLRNFREIFLSFDVGYGGVVKRVS